MKEDSESVWRRVERKRVSAPHSWRFRSSIWASAGVLVLAAMLWLVIARRADDGPLRDSTGQPFNDLGASNARDLSDGSRIELAANSELQVLSNDATTFSCALRRGRGTFEVRPGGPRRWRVDAGSVQVEVVGTRFVVDRTALGTRVSVARGTVLVRGEHVPDGVQKLTVGGELLVPNSQLAVPMSAAEAELLAVPDATITAPEKAARTPLPAAAPSVHLSLALADEQRRQGNVGDAIHTLTGIMNQPGNDPERAMAAFTLGKLQLDSAGKPAQAVVAFRNCLRFSPPSAVAEDALARLVQAQARSGDLAGARSTARDYELRYPTGRRLTDVWQWVSAR